MEWRYGCCSRARQSGFVLFEPQEPAGVTFEPNYRMELRTQPGGRAVRTRSRPRSPSRLRRSSAAQHTPLEPLSPPVRVAPHLLAIDAEIIMQDSHRPVRIYRDMHGLVHQIVISGTLADHPEVVHEREVRLPVL